MMKTLILSAGLALALGLGACGEKPQTASTKKTDAPAWKGADNAYAAAGWKAGDQAGWEQQMRVRAQGQNEYSRTAAQ